MDSNYVSKFITFNCKSAKRSSECIVDLCKSADIIALQETWLMPHELPTLGNLDKDFCATSKSAMDPGILLRGRPYGGVAILWRKSVFPCVSVITCRSVRLVAIKVDLCDRSFLVLCVYMPTDSSDNLIEFVDCLGEMSAIIENNNTESVFILGDFNAHPGELFCNELLNFCCDQKWDCVDMSLLPSDTYTFISEAHGCRRWLDHCVVTNAAQQTVLNAKVHYSTFWSDHFPLEIECNINVVKPKIICDNKLLSNMVIWGERDTVQIEKYSEICDKLLSKLDLESELCHCGNNMCLDTGHRTYIDNFYHSIVNSLCDAATSSHSHSVPKLRRGKTVTGWNKYVHSAHREARLYFQLWVLHGKSSSGYYYDNMCRTRSTFKAKLKWCQNNQLQIKMDIMASLHFNKNFGKFWKETNKLNPKSSLPVSVDGVSEPRHIANLFKESFMVNSPLGPSGHGAPQSMLNADAIVEPVQVRPDDIASILKMMSRGKSPGHDGLSIEHFQYAGVHITRLLSLLFNSCIKHSYLPEDLMKTIVVPIIKNRTGDASDKSNYRPISLATTMAKVLDSVLDKYLGKCMNLHDGQFGFRPGLSTESAILCLKHTVRYYTDRKTPVFACFLDLSKAFDLVSYDILWDKLAKDTKLPSELSSLFRFWYGNQTNAVRWAGTLSDMYRLECGVRQGGLTSPKLFNLYMNGLIEELSSAGVGCSIDGNFINNISYADDMVLLCPSISALRKLLSICESYAATHGLKYNTKKSELMLFKAGRTSYDSIPSVSLCGSPLPRVSQFKYLGHWVTENLSDDLDIDRERRALAVRCNMLARRFSRCTEPVKITLFKAFCQSFYTCSLWVNYTQKAYSALRVQYNNAFRMMLGLPRFCSASGMFADANTDGFHAIMRKRVASLMHRVQGSTNIFLKDIAGKFDGPILTHWMRLHVISR